MYKILLVLLLAESIFGQQCGRPAISPNETPDIPRMAVDDDGVMRVVGGREAIPHSWPWQISLRIKASDFHTCGGSWLGGRWVITAAHCVWNDRFNPARFAVDVGRHRKDGNLDAAFSRYNVQQIFAHEFYNPSNIDNDIALILLEQEVVARPEVSPICLPTSDVVNNQQCFVSGWGATQGTCCFGFLKQALLPHIDSSICRQNEWWGFRITENMLCAGYAQGTHGGCFGDSGGPYVCKNANGQWKLNGLVSWGSSTCRAFQKPTVFTRVHVLLNWIEIISGLRPFNQDQSM